MEPLFTQSVSEILIDQSKRRNRLLFSDILQEAIDLFSPIRFIPKRGFISILHDIRGHSTLTFKERRAVRRLLLTLLDWTIKASTKKGGNFSEIEKIWVDELLLKAFSYVKTNHWRIAQAIGPLLFIDIEIRSGQIVQVGYLPCIGHLPLFEAPEKLEERNNYGTLMSTFDKLLDNFSNFTFAGHNLRNFDLEKIKAALPHRQDYFENVVLLDTLDYSILFEPFAHSHRLGSLAENFGCKIESGKNFHEADFDVEVNFSVFMILLAKTIAAGKHQIWNALEISRDWWSMRRPFFEVFKCEPIKSLEPLSDFEHLELDSAFRVGLNYWHNEPEKLLRGMLNDQPDIMNIIPHDWLTDNHSADFKRLLDLHLGRPNNFKSWFSGCLEQIGDVWLLRRLQVYGLHSISKHPILCNNIWYELNNLPIKGRGISLGTQDLNMVSGIKKDIIDLFNSYNSKARVWLADPLTMSEVCTMHKVCLWDAEYIWREFGFIQMGIQLKTLASTKEFLDQQGYILRSNDQSNSRVLVHQKFNLGNFIGDAGKVSQLINEISADIEELSDVSLVERLFVYQDFSGAVLLDLKPRPFPVPTTRTAIFRGQWAEPFSNEIVLFYGFLGFNREHKSLAKMTGSGYEIIPELQLRPTVRIKTIWNNTAFGKEAYKFAYSYVDESKINFIVNSDQDWHNTILQMLSESNDKIYVESYYKLPSYWNSARIAQELKKQKSDGKIVIFLCPLYAIPRQPLKTINVIVPEWLWQEIDPTTALWKKYAIRKMTLFMQGNQLEKEILPFFSGSVNWLDSHRIVQAYTKLLLLKRAITLSDASVVLGSKILAQKQFEILILDVCKVVGIRISSENQKLVNKTIDALPEPLKFSEIYSVNCKKNNHNDRQQIEISLKYMAMTVFGIQQFRSISYDGLDQSQPMADALDNKDVLVLAATGTSKSLIYQLDSVLSTVSDGITPL